MCTLPTAIARAGAQDTGRLKQLADSISGATITQSSGPLPCVLADVIDPEAPLAASSCMPCACVHL